ncbi:glycosyltransferase [Methylomagnum sp.]
MKREITVLRQTRRPPHFAALSASEAYVLHNTLRPELHAILRESVTRFNYLPTISILMPVYNVDPRWLTAAMESVINQIYPHWELCIADDASTTPETIEALKQYEGRDKIKIIYRRENGHICAASNSASELASGDFVALLDNDDLLAPNALFEIARLLNAHPEADLIYTDEDKIDAKGRHYDLHFKPDWSPVLLLGYNYINHLTCIRRSLLEEVGRFSLGFEGAQDYDLLLRLAEHTKNIFHIPKILYHWRSIPESTASSASVKPIVDTSAYKALKNHLDRQGIVAKIYRPSFAESYGLPINQLDWSDEGPGIEIIIFGDGKQDYSARCASAIQKSTRYRNYRIASSQTEYSDFPASLPTRLNAAAKASDADLLLFLSNRTTVTEPRWLSRLAGYSSLPGVGIVGGRLITPKGHLHQAGKILADSSYFPAFSGEPVKLLSYFFLAETARDCSAVNIACLLTRRSDFIEAGGFSEILGSTGFDVDYCLRIAEQGLRTVFVAEAELSYTTESTHPFPGPRDIASRKYLSWPCVDRYYNPNLLPPSFTVNPVSRLDYGEYIEKPLKCAFFTHNLNLEGAPKVILNLAADLHHGGGIDALVFSPEVGPATEFLNQAGVPFEVIQLTGCDNMLSGWADLDSFNATLGQVSDLLKLARPDVVVVNVLNSFFVVEAAARLGIPCVWIIHESYHRDLLIRAIDSKAFPIFEAAFTKANAVVFVSEETRQLYNNYNRLINFTVIHNALSKTFLNSPVIPKDIIRNVLGIADGMKVIVSIGTVCERKDQKTLVRAIESLSKIRDDFLCFIVGWRASDHYCHQVSDLVQQYGLTGRVILVPETRDVAQYYSAADLFAFTSLNESYSLTMLEAMAYGLPVITTACMGVSEQVQFGHNAVRFDFQDHNALSGHLASLLDDDGKRIAMGKYSRQLFEAMPTYDEVVQSYKNLIISAWQVGSLNRNG